MKASPAKRYRKPNYPDKLEVLATPGLLQEHVPSAWKRSARVTGALAIFAGAQTSMIAGCAAPGRGQDASAKPSLVAPIFVHGEGRGAAGCVAIAPPIFLSEDEAAQVISETLAIAKISVSKQPYSISTGLSSGVDADLYSPESKIAVEFVGSDDYFKLGGKQSKMSVQSYDLQGAASQLAKAARVKDVRIGIFYDPMVCADLSREDRGSNEKSIVDAKAKAKSFMEAQVKDFVEWIKVQGTL